MTAPPDIYAMDVDEWYDAVSTFADRIEDEIHTILDETTTPEAAETRLDELLEPNYIDPDDEHLSGQLLVWRDDQRLCIGVPLEDYAEAIYDDQHGHWRLAAEALDDSELERSDWHRRIAQFAVGTVLWGDPDHINYMETIATQHRQLATPYLQAVESALESGDPTAADLRDTLITFLTACGVEEHTVEIHDVSPDAHRTHLEFRTPGGVSGRLFAIAPGGSLDPAKLREFFAHADFSDVMIVTDHLQFHSLMSFGEDSVRVLLPAQRDDDFTTYHRAITDVITMMSHAVGYTALCPVDDYFPAHDHASLENALEFQFTEQSLAEPRQEEFYQPFLQLMEAWRKRRINSFKSETYHEENFLLRSDNDNDNDDDSDEYLSPLRLYPETLQQHVDVLDGQFHYFLQKHPDRSPPCLRIGIEVRRPAQNHRDDDGAGESGANYSWDIIARWFTRPGLHASELNPLQDAGFRIIAGALHEPTREYDNALAAAEFFRSPFDDQKTYILRIERAIEWDELNDWNSRSEQARKDNLDKLVARMRAADEDHLPGAQSTTYLLALINELHPAMRSFLISTEY